MKRYKRNKFLPLILLLFLVMTVGFAYLRTSLSINGSANFKENSWNIYFDNVQVKNGSVTPVTAPTIPSNDKTTVSFEVNLNNIGDFYEFTIDVVNDGTIDAMVDSFIFSPELTDAQKKYLEYDVRYANGSKIKVHDLLRAESSETLRVKLRYKNDLNPEDLPSSPDVVEPTVTIVYVQATDEAEEIVGPPTLLATTSTDKTKFRSDDYKQKIKTITFEREINVPNTAVEVFDIGVNQNGDVMSFLSVNVDDNTMYDLHIQSDDELYANENMSYWFYDMQYVESIYGLELLNISVTINMQSLFYKTGYNAATFNIEDLSGWDTSSVTSMSFMFCDIGYNALLWNIGDLSDWNTSNVTNMSYMFSSTGYKATTWNIGDLSDWNTSNVTNMNYMFSHAGFSASSFDISFIEKWNTSDVTNMNCLFSHAGYNAITWNLGNLKNWNTSKVTLMSNMFSSAGNKAKTWDIGDLSNWDTSKVTDMSAMFSYAGDSATTFNIGNIGRWDTSKVTNMAGMFSGSGKKATIWNIGDLGSWDTSKVTNMSNMFHLAGYHSSTKISPNVSGWNVNLVTNYTSFNDLATWITPPVWVN